MSQRRGNFGTSADEILQQPTADTWDNVPAPTWMGPLAYYNNEMEGRFQTGLSLTGDPRFNVPASQQRSTPMEDTLFEINQTGLSPMWRDPSPAFLDPRVGRPTMQARTPLPFQYVTEPPSVITPTNTCPTSWETSTMDAHLRGQGPASNTARQPDPYQPFFTQPVQGEAIRTRTPTPVQTSQGYPAPQYFTQPVPGETTRTRTPTPVQTSQGYPVPQYAPYPPYPDAPYPPYPGPLTLPVAPLPGPTAYDIMQPEQLQQQQPLQAASPTPMLVQLGASQNFLVNNRPARWIQVLDVDPSYQRARTPSPNRSPALSIYVRAPETEVHYWAVFLRELTVQELIKRVVQKYGFSNDERDRVGRVVRVSDHGVQYLVDEDVRSMESEVAIDVSVTSLDPQSEDWQLELRY